MKQTKRFWLIAVAVLLATILVSGLALADDSKIRSLKSGEVENHADVLTHVFYGIPTEVKNDYAGLFSAKKKTTYWENDAGATYLHVCPMIEGSVMWDILFDWDEQSSWSNYGFLFKTGDKALQVVTYDEDGNEILGDVTKEEEAVRSVDLKWDGKTFKDFKLTVIAVNDPADTKDNSHEVVFTISIKKVATKGLIITNKLGETQGTFDYSIDEKQVDQGRDASGYLRLVEKYAEFDPNYERLTIHTGKAPAYNNNYINVMRESWRNGSTADVKYEISYDPANLRVLAADEDMWCRWELSEFIRETEKDVDGFTVVASDSKVGYYDATKTPDIQPIKQYVQEKDDVYYPWGKAEGSVTITIKAVDDEERVISKFGSAVATLNFKINKETEVIIRALNPADPKKEVVPTVGVNRQKDAYYGYYDGEGRANGFVLDVDINDPNGNKVDATYHNPDIDLVWSSSDPEILRVTKDGRITGIKVGEAYLVATSKLGVKGKILVKVVDKEKSKITKIAFNQEPAVYNLAYGAERPISAYVITTPAKVFTYSVSSADSSIVAVGSDWVETEDYRGDGYFATIKGMKVGTTTITVTPDGKPELAVTATINVVNAPKFAFDKEAYEGINGTWIDLSVSGEYDTEFDDYTWVLESSDIDVIDTNDDKNVSWNWNYGEKKVHGKLSVYAKNPGTATVTLKNKNDPSIAATTVVTVKQGKFALSMKKESIKLYFTKAAGDDSNYSSSHADFTSFVKVKPASGNVDLDGWSFKTSNKKVAVVSVKGVIEATGAGEAVITGTYDDGVNKAELELKVVVETVDSKVDPDDPEPAKANPIEVEVDQYYIMVVKGGDNTLPATAYDKVTGEEVDVTWTSSDRKLATVSKSGVITGKGAGKVVITATTKDGTQKFSIGVKILHKPVEKIKTDSAITLVKGEKYTPVIEIEPKHAYDSSLSFKSDNKKVATVNENGTITAKKPGDANITVKAKDGSGVTAVIKVTVTK
jgi:uncharacterized protein YjdB